MNPVVHRDEFDPIPRDSPDPRREHMLLRAPPSENHAMEAGSPLQSQGPGPLHLGVRGPFRSAPTSTRDVHQKERKEEAGPRNTAGRPPNSLVPDRTHPLPQLRLLSVQT